MPALGDIHLRDPFVLLVGQTYYLYGSTDPDVWRGPGIGFDAYRGAGPGVLDRFDGPHPVFRPPADFWGRTNFWAPEVYSMFHMGKKVYFMFATFQPAVGCRGTAVLKADHPLGPFRPWSDGPLTPPDWACLDGSLCFDREARPWMVFCHEWQQVGDGQLCALPLTGDLRAAQGPPQVLFSASQAPWTAPLAGRPPGSYVTDGPWTRRDAAGRLWLLWSSFGPDGDYRLGQAVSDSGHILGPWRHLPQPLHQADGGHGMVFRAPDGGLVLALHRPNRSPDERPAFLRVADTGEGLAVIGGAVA